MGSVVLQDDSTREGCTYRAQTASVGGETASELGNEDLFQGANLVRPSARNRSPLPPIDSLGAG